VSRCFPGLTLTPSAGGDAAARLTFKAGPIRLTYAGTARLVRKDQATGLILAHAAGRETRRADEATVTVRCLVAGQGQVSDVTILTTLHLTGKPAKFGWGVLNAIVGKLVAQLAVNLIEAIRSGQADHARRLPEPADAQPASSRTRDAGAGIARAVNRSAAGPEPGQPARLEHADVAADVLRQLVTDSGPEILSRPAALSAILADLLPDTPRITRIMVAAAQDRLAARLTDLTTQGMDHDTAVRLVGASFAESTLLPQRHAPGWRAPSRQRSA